MFFLIRIATPLAFASKLDWYSWPIQQTRSLAWAERLIWVYWRNTLSAPSDLRWEKTLARFTTCPKPLQFQLTIFIPPCLLCARSLCGIIYFRANCCCHTKPKRKTFRRAGACHATCINKREHKTQTPSPLPSLYWVTSPNEALLG